MICVFCLFTRVYLQYFCICLQQYWRLVLQFIFNNFVIWCKIFAMENLFFNPITKKLQSSTTSIIDSKQQLPILAGHGTRTHDLWVASPVPYPFLHEISYWNSWKFTYINTYQTFAIWYKIFATWYKIFAIENLFLNSDTKYLQLKIYFSIHLQNICNHPPHQSLTSDHNSPSSLAMGLEPTTSGFPAQCLIRSSTRSLIEIHENLPILTHIRLL